MIIKRRPREPLSVAPEDVSLAEHPELAEYRSKLRIDKDDLDECLIEQPELFDHVAEAYSRAVAERDELKLDLEIAEAEASQQIREMARVAKEKPTEGSIKEQLLLLPNIQRLSRQVIQLKARIDAWGALKESYSQRSYMLKELVPMYLSRLYGTSTGSSRKVLADDLRERTGEARMRRGSYGT